MIYNDPWTHAIVDDVYFEHDNHCDQGITDEQGITRWFIQEPMLQQLAAEYLDTPLFDIKSYDPVNLGMMCHFTLTPPNFIHSSHYDADFKLISMIIYIGHNNIGTTLTAGDRVKMVEWKDKRALIFAPQANVTWHHYQSNSDQRFTLNIFVVDKSKIQNELYRSKVVEFKISE